MRRRTMSSETKLTPEQRRRIFCVKHGHSRLRDHFFGYHYCARCGDQLGDSLGGAYRDDSGVYVHHMHVITHGTDKERREIRECPCAENAKKLTKRDFVMVPQWNSWGYEQRPPWRKRDDRDESGEARQ
jgi:hypothetical protein